MKATIFSTKTENQRNPISVGRTNVFMRNDSRLPNECEIKQELQERLIIVATGSYLCTYELESTQYEVQAQGMEGSYIYEYVMSIIN